MTHDQQLDQENPFGNADKGESAREHLEAAVALRTDPGPERFFNQGGGLLAEALREVVVEDLLLARGPGRELYVYEGGLWKRGGNDAVSAKVIDLLGERNRITHANLMIENILVTTPYVIGDEPLHRWINFRNGMLDWRERKLYGHNPELMSVSQLPYDWDPTATCPRSDQFMREVFHPDAMSLGYEMIGYAMYDGNPLQKAVMLLGSGANGKGVYLRLVEAVLGEENVSAVPLQILTSNRFAAADLHGRLANIAGDLPSTRVEDTSIFKMITGDDLIRAERKYLDAFTFKARAVPMFSANELPGSADNSTGYIRRWIVVEFPHTFPPERRDPRLSEALASERAGVAVKAVEALRTLMDRGEFAVIESVVEAQSDMARLLNPIKDFFDDRIEIKGGCETSRSAIYEAYRSWCNTTRRNQPLGERRFWPRFRTEMMIRMGLAVWDKSLERRTSSDRLLVGVYVTPGFPQLTATS